MKEADPIGPLKALLIIVACLPLSLLLAYAVMLLTWTLPWASPGH